MRIQAESFSPERNLCYLTVLNLFHSCQFGHGQNGWKNSVLLLSENCSDICFGLAYIGSVLEIGTMSLDFEEVDSGLLFDSDSIYVHFLHQCYFL